MKRTNVSDEFARIQRETQRVVELLGDLMAEPNGTEADQPVSRGLSLIVQRQPVLRYTRTS
jgi:hypothetical protein